MSQETTGIYVEGQFFKGTKEEAIRSAGAQWNMSHVFTGLANLATIDTLIITGNKPAMLHNSIVALGDFHMYIYEDTVVTANGTTHVLINPNRVTQLPILTTAFLTPTIAALGTQLSHELIIGGTSGGGMGNDNRSAGAGERTLILKPNSNYLIRHTNESGAATNGTLFSVLSEYM